MYQWMKMLLTLISHQSRTVSDAFQTLFGLYLSADTVKWRHARNGIFVFAKRKTLFFLESHINQLARNWLLCSPGNTSVNGPCHST